jgi:hypothetical protein
MQQGHRKSTLMRHSWWKVAGKIAGAHANPAGLGDTGGREGTGGEGEGEREGGVREERGGVASRNLPAVSQ